jgi:hypothetical protein
MLLKFFFKQFSHQRQVAILKKNGILLGTRLKDGRKVHIYMLRDLFAEVIYKNDDIEDEVESLNLLKGLNNLNEYLENEFKTSF